jgi:hypothetical protein
MSLLGFLWIELWRIASDRRFFPTCLIVLDVCAALRYGIGEGDVRKTIYWAAAAALTTVVTW